MSYHRRRYPYLWNRCVHTTKISAVLYLLFAVLTFILCLQYQYTITNIPVYQYQYTSIPIPLYQYTNTSITCIPIPYQYQYNMYTNSIIPVCIDLLMLLQCI